VKGKDIYRFPITDEEIYRTHPAFAEKRKAEALHRLQKPHLIRAVWIQLGVFAIVLLLWKIPILNPVKLLVVLLHELSHVFMAYLSGGRVFGIAIDPGGAGVTLGVGGNEILILAAGYIGSFLIGWLLYALSAIWRPDEVLGILLVFACLTLGFDWLNEFTAFFGFGTIFLIFLALTLLTDEMRKFTIQVVATTCYLYPLIDVGGELFQKKSEGFLIGGAPIGSDVMRLAGLTGIPAFIITFVWVTSGLVLAIYLILWSAQKDAETKIKRSFFRPGRISRFEHPLYDPGDPSTIPEYTIR
jgi:hypothetical protein